MLSFLGPAVRCRSRLRLGSVAAVLLGGCSLLSCSTPARAEELYRAAEKLQAEHAAEIEELAAWCDKHELTDEAQKTRRLLGPRDPYKLYLPILPRKTGRAELPTDSPAEVIEWDERFAHLQRSQSDALFDLAQRAVRRQRASLAYELLLAAIRINPEHKAGRRILGYQPFRGEWRTAYEVRKLRAGQVWHEKFGWIPKSHVRRYEQGQRHDRGRWITAEEDAQRHRDIESGWLVETEHYVIRTNHSLEVGVAMGAKLERLFHVWQQLFVRYYATKAQLLALFDGRARTRIPPFRVVFFRDREDYNRSFRADMPNIDISIGVYVEQTRRAYFCAGEGYEDRTLFHEATHQLFHESRRVADEVGYKANFWIVEGIAAYMESLREENGYYVLGGLDDERMHAARYRLLEDDFYVPLEELIGYGMERIQEDKRIATLYSQAAGLTNFLIYYDGGRYRDALVAYLTSVYEGRDTPETLAQLTDTSYAELDKQYRRFMEESLKKTVGGKR